MTTSAIANRRLAAQQIEDTEFSKPGDIVHWMGAVQAQDYSMAKWAIGLRLSSATDAMVEKAINKGEIIRTHILRPTWHFVSAKDVRWMLELTAPQIQKAADFMNRQLELDAKLFSKTNRIIVKALKDGNHLSRQQLMQLINKAGIKTNTLRAAHIMFDAELKGIVCNGIIHNKQFTYALLDERIAASKRLSKEEALAELAKRYFTSHGPATIKDFIWWSGLTASDARAGLESSKKFLAFDKIGNEIYWLSPGFNPERKKEIHLLPAFDEFMVSYKDRSASLPLLRTKTIITNNGIFKPIIVIDGKVAGLWKISKQNNSISFHYSLFTSVKPAKAKLAKAIERYAAFTGNDIKEIRPAANGI